MKNERKLASVQKIVDIQPIPGADNIEVVSVKGWKCVSKKGEFSIGDSCVYFEVDSFLPIVDEFEFLRGSSFRKMKDDTEGFRLKTIKLRKQISQGLCLTIHEMYKLYLKLHESKDPYHWAHWFEGMDLTSMLKVRKYEIEIPAQLAGTVKGGFPAFIRKTDEERVQNLPEIFTERKNEIFYATEKLDGTSSTFYMRDSEFGVCSRNLDLARPELFVSGMELCDDGIERPKKENTYWKLVRELHLEDRIKSLDRNISLQGEMIGEGIQKNKYKLEGQTIKWFNAFDIDKFEYLIFDEFLEIMDKLQLTTVPIISKNFKLPETMAELIEMSDGMSLLNKNVRREGIVYRTLGENRFSFKVISNKFLLKHGE